MWYPVKNFNNTIKVHNIFLFLKLERSRFLKKNLMVIISHRLLLGFGKKGNLERKSETSGLNIKLKTMKQTEMKTTL